MGIELFSNARSKFPELLQHPSTVLLGVITKCQEQFIRHLCEILVSFQTKMFAGI
jgi:hypothetical protein